MQKLPASSATTIQPQKTKFIRQSRARGSWKQFPPRFFVRGKSPSPLDLTETFLSSRCFINGKTT
jgi:hypothetical protein